MEAAPGANAGPIDSMKKESRQQGQGQGQGNNQKHRYNTCSQACQNQGQNHNIQGTNGTSGQGTTQTHLNFQQGETNATSGHSFAAIATFEPDVLSGPDFFFTHEDKLEPERYNNVKNLRQETHKRQIKVMEDQMEGTEIYDDDLIPTAKQLNDVSGRFIFRFLLNHGDSHVMLQRQAVPHFRTKG